MHDLGRRGKHGRQIAAKCASDAASAMVSFRRTVNPRISPSMRIGDESDSRILSSTALECSHSLMVLRRVGGQFFPSSWRQPLRHQSGNQLLGFGWRSHFLQLRFDGGNRELR
jgi:hypothetical protein